MKAPDRWKSWAPEDVIRDAKGEVRCALNQGRSSIRTWIEYQAARRLVDGDGKTAKV